MTTLGEPVTDEQLTEMLQQFDTDGDGRVKYSGTDLFLINC